ncbi:MAG: metallophosphoesterase family protein [Euryarchaeota archaeon]|nr:metallophosphoesterase family protein [Euryarchaeota archaeon]
MVRLFPLGIIVLVSAVVFSGYPASSQGASGPVGVHIAWGTDPMTAVSVSWSAPPATMARVDYGPTTGYGASAPATYTATGSDSPTAFRATLQGLAPATTYHYRAVTDSMMSRDFTFTTARERPERFTVAVWGDHGVPDPGNPAAEADGDNPLKNVAFANGLRADFHLVAGDLSYANGVPRTWDAYFAALEPYASHVPYMSAVGNHEREAGQQFLQYDARLPMPTREGERWYAFRYGDAVFISLDTEHACDVGPAGDAVPGLAEASCANGANEGQLRFLESTLAAARADPSVRWILAFHHYPLWSDGPHGSNLPVRAIWGPVFDKYHLDVDIQAHDHLYERTKMITGEAVSETGTTYLVAGVGGASHYAFTSPDSQPPAWEAARNNRDYGVVLLTFSNGSLIGEFKALDGSTKDRWALQKGLDGVTFSVDPANVTDPKSSPGNTSSDDAAGGSNRVPGLATGAILVLVASMALALRRRRMT